MTTDTEGRVFCKIASIGAPVAGNTRYIECFLECGHMVCAARPRVGAELNCKRCERLSERHDVGDDRKRVSAGKAA